MKRNPRTQSILESWAENSAPPTLRPVLHRISFPFPVIGGGRFRITLSHIISFRFHAINLPYEPISL